MSVTQQTLTNNLLTGPLILLPRYTKAPIGTEFHANSSQLPLQKPYLELPERWGNDSENGLRRLSKLFSEQFWRTAESAIGSGIQILAEWRRGEVPRKRWRRIQPSWYFLEQSFG